MVAENTKGDSPESKPNVVKAMPTSPVYAVFDIVEVEGKQIITGMVGFTDQFGMERTAKTGTEAGVLNLGKHILAIFEGHVDITEPDEETKKALAENLVAETKTERQRILNAYAKGGAK